MINVRAVLLAFILCTVMPAETAATIKGDAIVTQREYWWSMLYPQFCGEEDVGYNADKQAIKEEKIKLKVLELFAHKSENY